MADEELTPNICYAVPRRFLRTKPGPWSQRRSGNIGFKAQSKLMFEYASKRKKHFRNLSSLRVLNQKDGMTFVFFYAPLFTDNDLQQRQALIILQPSKIILTNTFRRHLHYAKLLKLRPCWFDSSISIYVFIFYKNLHCISILSFSHAVMQIRKREKLMFSVRVQS